ncbi:hypothetical protein HHK36_016047 [Tetracentron sinense]|uniref:Saposin-like type B region 1 domain-containing protein n=1 Tax=Tetracentron sinense TaxID=13715 RepID=A0A834Z0Q2_TETSI|nr:hypothetical protein HHK36_016047 [Tetracentron sinense]
MSCTLPQNLKESKALFSLPSSKIPPAQRKMRNSFDLGEWNITSVMACLDIIWCPNPGKSQPFGVEGKPSHKSIMGVRVWLLFLLVLGASWTCANSRGLVISDLLSRDLVISEVSEANLLLVLEKGCSIDDSVLHCLVMQINYLVPKKEIQAIETVAKDNKVCTLCEEFTSQALIYLGENKTQTEIIDILHHTCSQMHSFKQEVVTYFALQI